MNEETFTHGSLFSGIGGFDLASEWMGWENLFHCEWNEFGQRVLKYYWPNAELFTDITKSDFTKYAHTIDILTGGFPCQPYSIAGKRKGKEDNRHLWPEMLRAIREIQPTYVVGENVSGLISWDRGLVFHEVQTDLENEGYEVFPFVLPACAVNAPHRRDRVWFIAHNSNSTRCKSEKGKTRGNEVNINRNNSESEQERNNIEYGACLHRDVSKSATSNPNSNGQYRSNSEHEINPSERGFNALNDIKQTFTAHTEGLRINRTKELENNKGQSGKWGRCDIDNINKIQLFQQGYWENFPTQPPVCIGNDGFSTKLDGITFPKWRNESIKAAGNAIVPQVVYQIFKSIQQIHN